MEIKMTIVFPFDLKMAAINFLTCIQPQALEIQIVEDSSRSKPGTKMDVELTMFSPFGIKLAALILTFSCESSCRLNSKLSRSCRDRTKMSARSYLAGK